jgi:hypothetical protein
LASGWRKQRQTVNRRDPHRRDFADGAPHARRSARAPVKIVAVLKRSV